INGYELAQIFNEAKLPGVIARPVSFIPTYQKYNGEICSGIQIHITNRNEVQSLKTGIKLIEIIQRMYPNDFEFKRNENGKYFFDLIAGTKKLKDMIKRGESNIFLKECEDETKEFIDLRKKYLLYT
ncbi:MAG TPA: DUF1343 domain-containing protein, partial [Pseudogracilibacillus sp.]|nr:DUF1343 domain-containing protein [Pseudogracilibacillus sp.]